MFFQALTKIPVSEIHLKPNANRTGLDLFRSYAIASRARLARRTPPLSLEFYSFFGLITSTRKIFETGVEDFTLERVTRTIFHQSQGRRIHRSRIENVISLFLSPICRRVQLKKVGEGFTLETTRRALLTMTMSYAVQTRAAN